MSDSVVLDLARTVGLDKFWSYTYNVKLCTCTYVYRLAYS